MEDFAAMRVLKKGHPIFDRFVQQDRSQHQADSNAERLSVGRSEDESTSG
jgi:hypothetical protein